MRKWGVRTRWELKRIRAGRVCGESTGQTCNHPPLTVTARDANVELCLVVVVQRDVGVDGEGGHSLVLGQPDQVVEDAIGGGEPPGAWGWRREGG